MNESSSIRLCNNAATWTALLLSSYAVVAQPPAKAIDAVREAERFIRAGQYDVKRDCPETLRRLDAAGHVDMQRHCRNYDACEATALAISDEGIVWRVFFRKSPPEYSEGSESFRVVEVFRNDCPTAGCVVLKDIELFLPPDARVLNNRP